MPKPVKESPIPRTLSNSAVSLGNGSLLDRATDVSTMRRAGLKVSLYGQPKTGKTRLMCSFPKPLMILGSEDGTASVQTSKDTRFVRVIGNTIAVPKDDQGEEIKNFVRLNELGEFIKQLRESKYATIGVDTASILADIVLADILGIDEVPAQKSWGFASREQYGAQGLQVRTIFSDVLATGKNIVITAHEKNFNAEAGGGEMMAPTIGSSLSEKLCGWLNGAVDYVCQTFKRAETKETEEEITEGNKIIMRTPTGKAEYCLRVGPHPVYMTGFRLPDGYELPDVVVNPTYEKILGIIQGKGGKK